MGWVLSVLLVLVGVAGTLLPVLPGAVCILAGAVVHKLMVPGVLTWWTVGIIALLAVADWAASFFSSALGAKFAGATRAGVIGAGLGFVVGIFFALPGMILGPIVGAMVGEMVFAKRSAEEAGKAALGTGVGMLAGTAARFVLAAIMVAALVVDWFVVTG